LGAARLRGLTLIELMISIVLGLLIVIVAITVLLSNRQVYASTESLGRIQENTRTAFELMARDVREAAGNACESSLPLVNVLNGSTSNWWTDFTGGLTGYDGGTASPGLAFGTSGVTRIAGTDAIDLKSAVSSGITIEDHQPASADFKLNTSAHGINPGDVVMACDFDHAAIFQISGASPGTNPNVVHNTGTIGTGPGNTTKCLSMTGVCSPTGYAFGCKGGDTLPSGCPAERWPATIAKLRMTRWFVGNNSRGGQSLYQASLQNIGGSLSIVNNEVVEGVRNMQLTYLVDGTSAYVDANPAVGPPVDWSKVLSVRINLRMEGEGRTGTDGNPLQRDLIHTVAIRNRAP
jgi:type IV pilus assembly protein PilW